MTDLEITRLCAEAMGYSCIELGNDFYRTDDGPQHGTIGKTDIGTLYDPLNNDAQAMALVKRFKADICWALDSSGNDGLWFVDIGDTTSEGYADRDADLNRAICLCVAKMQAAK